MGKKEIKVYVTVIVDEDDYRTPEVKPHETAELAKEYANNADHYGWRVSVHELNVPWLS